MMSASKLLELYRCDQSGHRAIVVQNLQNNVQKDNLQNYLEVICLEELKELCFPIDGAGVAVAIFEENVKEIEQWQRKASTKRFEGSFPSIQLLGEPSGVFLSDVPGKISEEFLSLYFESRKSGGEEDTVHKVEIINVAGTTYALVEITSKRAIKPILSKQTHHLRNTAVVLEPYYPSVHKYSLDVLKDRQDQTEMHRSPAITDDVMYERATTPEDTFQRQQVKPVAVSSPIQGNKESQVVALDQPIQSLNTENTANRNSDTYFRGKNATNETEKMSYPSNNAFKLKIISDDTDEEEEEIPIKTSHEAEAQCPRETDMRQSAPVKEKHFSHGKRDTHIPIVATVKPIARNTYRQNSNESDDGSSRPKGKRSKARSKQNEGNISLSLQNEIQLLPVKITMLRIFRFPQKTETATLKVKLMEKEGKVIINGQTDGDIKHANLKLHECLDQIEYASQPMPREKCIFLSREACQICLRQRCITQKMRTFVVDESRSMIQCYAFSTENAEKGLQMVKDKITVLNVQLRQEQEQIVQGDGWKNLIKKLDSGVTTVYVDDSIKNLLVIESFIEAKAQDAKRGMIEFLKEHVPRKSGEVVLESAKARCFKSCCEDRLRQVVENRRGKFDMKIEGSDPLKLRVSVEGEESLIAELTKMVDQIWHERIDFSKISDKAEDKWLMLKGLGGSVGKDFIKGFERQHRCFIQVSKEGEFKLPKPRIQIDEIQSEATMTYKTDDPADDENEFTKATEEFEEQQLKACLLYDLQKQQQESERERRLLYQADVGEDDAIQQAIAMSLQDRESLHWNKKSELFDEEVVLLGDDDMFERIPQRQQSDSDTYGRQYGADEGLFGMIPQRQRGERGMYGRQTSADEGWSSFIPQRQQSDSDIFDRQHEDTRERRRHMRRTTSSPVFPRQSHVYHEIPTRTERIQMMRTTVTLTQGEIAKVKADALVNIVSPSNNFTESVVAKAFVKTAGQEIIQMYAMAKSQADGIVVKTDTCGRLKCSSVFHVVLQKGEKNCHKLINEAMSEVFQECEGSGYTSVALPPLGVGRMYKYPPETVAERMLAETFLQVQQGCGLNSVTVVVYDDATYSVFDKAFKAFDASSVSRYTAFQQNPFQPRIVQNISPGNLVQNQAQYQQGHGPYQNQHIARMGLFPQQSLRPREPLDTLKRYQSRESDRKNVVQTRPSVNRAGVNQTAKSTYEQLKVQKQDQDRRFRAHAAKREVDRRTDRLSKRVSSPDTDRRETRPKSFRTGQAERNYGERQKTKQRRSPRSRFPERQPASNLTVVVVAECKDKCLRARNELGKCIKNEFLHEETFDKRQKISEDGKRKIVSIIGKHNIESVKENHKYVLKGHKDSVARARIEILEVLLDEKDSTEKINRKRKESARRETKEFVQIMVEEDPEVPSYWKVYKPHGDVSLKSLLTKFKNAITQQKYATVDLDSNGYTFQTIQNMVTATFDNSKLGQGQDAIGLMGYSQLRVLKLQRIENLELYDKYSSARKALFYKLFKSGDVKFPNVQNLPNCNRAIETTKHVKGCLTADLHQEINEVLLFHGTKSESVKIICSGGLDQRLGSGKAMFGPGIYGAECSTKADQYSDDKKARTAGQGNAKQMFLIRMVLGNTFLCNDPNPHKYRRPPCTTCLKDDCKDSKHEGHKFGHLFDSVVGDNGKLFREFVVYESAQCYPEYLITYERV